MRKAKNTILSTILAIIMLFTCTCLSPVYADTTTSSNFVYGGWFETLYAEWSDTNLANATVQYKKSSDTDYITVDSELIRNYNGNGRVDIVGITSGNYDLKITSGNGTIFSKENITVKPHDRTGYAHKNYDRGVGAYKNDGTPKEGAIVVYVTDENKDTITIPGYEDYGIGIGWLLNNNNAFMSKLVEDGHPLIVRFVGTVTPPEGLTVPASIENGGNVKDNGFMCIIKASKDVTLEGIGYDATIEGWGFSFFVGDGYTNYESYEVRNLTFQKYPEDALGFQGFQQDSPLNLKNPIERVWVHNNSFMIGYCENPTESDKHEGDGSCDFKRGQYYTMAYNYYKDCHKTNLVGASDTNLQYNMTFHHNYYDNCASRGPLARQANIHIYNTYFKGNTSKTVDARANAYIVSESNFYESCKNPILTKSGAVVKSYKDVFFNTQDGGGETTVSDMSEPVDSNCLYKNFELSDDFYEYKATSAAQAKADCIAYSGVMKKSSEIIENPTPDTIITNKPENAVSVPYSATFNDSSASDYFGNKLKENNVKELTNSNITTIDNILYKPSAKYSQTGSDLKLRAESITFKLDKNTVVGVECIKGDYAVVVYNEYGESVLSAYNGKNFKLLSAGTYIIQSGLSSKDAYLASLSFSEYTGTLPETETITTTEEPSTESTSENVTDDSDDDDDGDDDIIIDGLSTHVLDFTNNINTNNFFTASGKYKTSYSVDYNGKTFTKSLNMESSTFINFTTNKKGKINIVTYSTNAAPAILVDGKKITVPASGYITVDLEAGYHEIKKSTNKTFLFLVECIEESAEEEGFVFNGDIDGDGNVTFNDASKLLEYVLDKGSSDLTATQLEAAKLSENDKYITSVNVACIVKKALDSLNK